MQTRLSSDTEASGYTARLMPIRNPERAGRYRVHEDSADRLVLDNRRSCFAVALCFGGLAAVTWFGYPEGRGRTMAVLCSGLMLLGLGSLLRWRQLVFDGRARTFQSKTLFTRWTADLGRIEKLETETVERRKTGHERAHASKRTYTAYRLFLLVGGKRVLLNESQSGQLVGDIENRVLELRDGRATGTS